MQLEVDTKEKENTGNKKCNLTIRKMVQGKEET